MKYLIYVSSLRSDDETLWASNTRPESRKYLVELQGTIRGGSQTLALMCGVVKALDDLEDSCEVVLQVDGIELESIIADMLLGLSPRPAAGIGGSALERLRLQLSRHRVSLAAWDGTEKASLKQRPDPEPEEEPWDA